MTVELTGDNRLQFFIPKYFACGFTVLSEIAVFQYKYNKFYHLEVDGGIDILDNSLGIDWWNPTGKSLLGEKRYKTRPSEGL